MRTGREPTVSPLRRRVAWVAALAAVLATTTPTSVTGQSDGGWHFGTDPFAELWYHGLAMVGFDGFGRVPLYDAEYAWAARTARRSADVAPTPLERERGALQAALAADPAFEVFHFVPLYLTDAPIDVALDALEALDGGTHARTDARIATEVEALRRVLHEPDQRRTLASFVRALRAERAFLPRRDATELDTRARGVRDVWQASVDGPLGDFLAREGFGDGRVIVTPALGPEGRILEREGGSVVVVGATAGTEASAVVGAVVRELCFPTVRRALGPYEAWFDDRTMVSDVSDQAATRCGSLLLSARAPELVDAYQDRFGSTASEAAFLSAAGFPPGAAALEQQLDRALRRELELEEGSRRAQSGPAGR